MTTTWNLRPDHPILTWFVYRSGIPIIIFLIALYRVDLPEQVHAVSFTLGLLAVTASDRYLRNRSCQRPLRLLLHSLGAVVLATSSAVLSIISRDGGLAKSRWESRLQLRDIQNAIESIWSLSNLCVLLILWVVLLALARGMTSGTTRPMEGPVRPSWGWWFLGTTVALALVANLIVAKWPGLERATWPQRPLWTDLEAPVSFLSPEQSRHWPSRPWPEHPGPFESWTDQELSGACGSVASRLEQPGYELTSADAYFLNGLSRALKQRIQPGERDSAEFVAALLALSRRKGEEYFNETWLELFRPHVLGYLGNSKLSEAQIAAWRARAANLALTKSTDLCSIRGHKDLWERDGHPLHLLGYTFSASLANLVCEQTDRWTDLIEGNPRREATLLALNPETRAMLLVLELREAAARDGGYPASLATPLGSYRRIDGHAELSLSETSPYRPQTVIRLSKGSD